MRKLADIEVGTGATAKTVTSWAIEGLSLEPGLVLLDAQGRFFGWAGTMAFLPEAYAGDHLKLQKAQIEAMAAQEPGIARRFRQLPATAVAFAHVKMFDAEGTRFLDDQTVVVEAGKIVAAGPAASTPVPAGARVIEELTHINFVLMEALPGNVVSVSNTVAPFEGPGRYGKDVDLDKEPMASFIRELGAKKVVVDPTLVVYEGLYTNRRGTVPPAFAPFEASLPPATQRALRNNAAAPPSGVTLADYEASFRKMLELTRRLHEAGVPLVAGTDGSGAELVRELELYVQAGLTPAQALRTATLHPAQLVGADKATGSIAVGKQADLVLIAGDASRDVGAMRHTRWVMQGGALMNADELRQLAGFNGRPK
ncbi:amidohydrolase family protein [Ramlibacter albus]|uniref:Amidohydrolase family protein n=1 Tax=Ramlibacter albus TaxID=2079448 RepID=A0A923MC79_9BURK|nr:amidohydrolase family protein [Ramlibacter albus]MBC5766382.1 amidohydrolase family protein [Ramlibacter albus]